MLSPAQVQQRDGKLTASRVACLMTGDQAKIMDLWREMVGDPDFVPEDLSGVWPVQLGAITEPLNLEWFSRKHGSVSRQGEVVIGNPDWMAATLDGWSDQHGCPVECKHCGGREPLETIIARYQPQCHWQMLVTGARQCALSVILGANEPVVEFLPFDEGYAAVLIGRATEFMHCVWELRPPFAQEPVAAPVIAVKTYEFTGNNAWASNAADWLANIDGKKKAEKAEKELKAMVPADGAICHGHGVKITRDRGGRLTLRSGNHG